LVNFMTAVIGVVQVTCLDVVEWCSVLKCESYSIMMMISVFLWPRERNVLRRMRATLSFTADAVVDSLDEL
jgi:hypothetical protein